MSYEQQGDGRPISQSRVLVVPLSERVIRGTPEQLALVSQVIVAGGETGTFIPGGPSNTGVGVDVAAPDGYQLTSIQGPYKP